jgi:hypothetical protein
LLPNANESSNFTQDKSDENDNQEVSHQIFPTTRINNDQNELLYSDHSTKNNNIPQRSFSIYPSSLESTSNSGIEISNPRTIGKSILYQETNQDLDNPDYWMPVKHRCKSILTNKYAKQLRLIANSRNRFITKYDKKGSGSINAIDINLRYLTLRKLLYETENKLVVNNFDTSKYPAFRLNNDMEISNIINTSLGAINGNSSTNKNSWSHPDNSFSEVLPSADDENLIL